MKRSLYFAAALAIVGAVSCNKEIVDNTTPDAPEVKLATLTATIGEPGTKTSLATPENAHVDGSKTYWCAEDAISVFDGTSNMEYTIKDSESYVAAEEAVFEGEELDAEATEFFALYPYTETAEVADGVVKGAVLPAEQTAVEGNLPEGAALAVAYSTDKSALSFKNVATTIGFTLTEAATKVEFVAKGGESIAGTIDITFVEGLPTYTVQAEKGNSTVTLTDLEAGTYYFTILPDVTLSQGYELKIDGYTVKTGAKDVKLDRSKIYYMESLAPASDRALAFSAATAAAVVGESFVTPTLSGETSDVVYSSSNRDVATVDPSTGVVTLVGAGETTITASAPATFAYFAGEASYTLTVFKKSELGVIGVNGNWTDDIVMYETNTDNFYVAYGVNFTADGAFKIRKIGNFQDDCNYGSATTTTKEKNTVIGVFTHGSSADISVSAGIYDIYFDRLAGQVYLMESGKSYTEAIKQTMPQTTYSLIGSFGSWSTDYNMTYSGDGIWTIVHKFAKDDEWKIRPTGSWDASYNNVWVGYNYKTDANDGNLKMNEEGDYIICFVQKNKNNETNFLTLVKK